ncbi:MAG: hypothetical protein WCD89_27160 [Anaerocolumna sp.]
MKIFEGLTLESLFLIVFGVFIFVLGTTSLRIQIKVKKKGMVQEGTVVRSNQVIKRDAENYLIQNYYDIKIEYLDNGHKAQSTINSLQEFHEGDKIKIIKNSVPKGNMTLYENNTLPVIIPWTIILGGILISMIPTAQNNYGTQYVSFLLAAILILAGVSLIVTYIKDRNRKVIQLDATVIDILKWYSGKKDSKLIKQNASYYPILQYTLDNQQKTIRSKYSSSMESSYKIGGKKVLYFDYENLCVLERGPEKGMLVGGIILFCIAAIGIMSAVLGIV